MEEVVENASKEVLIMMVVLAMTMTATTMTAVEVGVNRNKVTFCVKTEPRTKTSAHFRRLPLLITTGLKTFRDECVLQQYTRSTQYNTVTMAAG